MATIRAVEIGFGTLSFTKNVINGQPTIETFSSVVAPVGSSGDLSGGLATRNTVKVQVQEEFYEVGPDAHMLNDRKSSRTLSNRYIGTPQYQALFKGALLYMNEEVIDLLVLALPVNTMNFAEELKAMMQKTHVIGDKQVVVKNVWVLCQPLAGFLAYAEQLGQEEFNVLAQSNVLCLDFGFNTADHIVNRGLKINYKRSGAQNMGMSAVLEEVAKTLKESQGFKHLDDLSLGLIDEAFYLHQGKLKISGRYYPFPKCEGKDCDGENVKNVHYDCNISIRQVGTSCLNEIRNSVGAGADIDLIVVMGGSHKQYLEAVKDNYPGHKVVIVDGPLTAVCRGMFYGGKQFYALLKSQKVA